MQLEKIRTGSNKVVVAPLGDIQWSGENGPTCRRALHDHIARVLDMDGWFLGMGDYIDFLSPSNRQRLTSAALYDTAEQVIVDKAQSLVDEVYDEFLKPTKDRWLGLLEGHHFFEAQGSTSDMWLAEKLGCAFLGTSAYVRLLPNGLTLWAAHGQGNSVLPTGPLNKLYHVSHGLAGADVYLIGHTTKMSAARLSRPRPKDDFTDLTHSDILLVNCGGFSKSSVIGHTHGRIVRGDYAEQKMLTPSPLGAPLIYSDVVGDRRIVRAEV